MQQIDAIFQDGVFKPVGPVALAEKQRVRLRVEPMDESDTRAALAWLEDVKKWHEQFLERHGGPLPDSTPDIAEDRMRDV